MSVEYALLKEYIDNRKRYEGFAAEVKTARMELDLAEEKLANYMADSGIEATSKYPDLGRVSLLAPKVAFCNYDKECEDEVFRFIERVGEGPMIKLQVHPSAFRSFVGRMLKAGETLPPSVEYGLKPVLRLSKP